MITVTLTLLFNDDKDDNNNSDIDKDTLLAMSISRRGAGTVVSFVICPSSVSQSSPEASSATVPFYITLARAREATS